MWLLQTMLCCAVLLPAPSSAQWWSSGPPKDFEECAERAKSTATTKDTLAECEARFAGRRKAGGGYTYFDFMQNRSFDIAGPNPTTEELKQIDVEYTAYLAERRRNIIAAAFIQKQQALQQQQQQVGVQAAVEAKKPIIAVKPVAKPQPKVSVVRVHPKPETCDSRLSCSWSELTTKMQTLKTNLFGTPSRKTAGG